MRNLAPFVFMVAAVVAAASWPHLAGAIMPAALLTVAVGSRVLRA